MFENLLMENEEREFEDELISNTLDRLSQETVLKLLKHLSMKFRINPRKSISLLRWLVPLLNRHAGSFAKNLESRKFLESISQTIDYHIKSIIPIMKLQGRLSLLVNQIDKVNKLNDNNNNNVENGLKQARFQALFTHFENKEEM